MKRVIPSPTDAALIIISEVPAECFDVGLFDKLLHLDEVFRFDSELVVVVREFVVVIESDLSAFFDFFDCFAFILFVLQHSFESLQQ